MAACGGNDNSGTGSQAASKAASTPAPNTSGSAGAVSLAPKGDQLMFDTSNLNAKAGKVTINFKNDSSLTHDIVLINSSNKILGQTPEFDGGTKSFSATLKPGTYTYYCSVPGHRAEGRHARHADGQVDARDRHATHDRRAAADGRPPGRAQL